MTCTLDAGGNTGLSFIYRSLELRFSSIPITSIFSQREKKRKENQREKMAGIVHKIGETLNPGGNKKDDQQHQGQQHNTGELHGEHRAGDQYKTGDQYRGEHKAGDQYRPEHQASARKGLERRSRTSSTAAARARTERRRRRRRNMVKATTATTAVAATATRT